jgi:hypothetical protein
MFRKNKITREDVQAAISEGLDYLKKHCLFHVSENSIPKDGQTIEIILFLGGTAIEDTEVIKNVTKFTLKNYTFQTLTRHCCTIDVTESLKKS